MLEPVTTNDSTDKYEIAKTIPANLIDLEEDKNFRPQRSADIPRVGEIDRREEESKIHTYFEKERRERKKNKRQREE